MKFWNGKRRFRRISLIIAPMLVAVVSVLCTMGLLIGLGFPVHIMSSMIAIFLMPIAVADSVHILSEFFDTYPRFRDKKEAVRHVVSHLFMPMLYTSLTTIAGFASLVFTPIPPVRVFGAHVAFGVGLAWFLTMTFVPAYIMLCVPKKMLDRIPEKAAHHKRSGLDGFLEKLGAFSFKRWKLILILSVLTVAVSAVGIQKIRVNDNPVKWFTPNHRIRIADDVLNNHFGGTYTAYLTLTPETAQGCTCFEALNVETVQDFPTVMESRVDDLARGGHTVNSFSNVQYDIGLNEAIFTERFLRRPPREATK